MIANVTIVVIKVYSPFRIFTKLLENLVENFGTGYILGEDKSD